MARKKVDQKAVATEPNNAEPSEPKPKVIGYLKALQDVPSVYADNTSIRSSIYGFRFIFGLVTDALADDTSGSIPINPQMILSVSPAHAKALGKLLTQQVEKYEQKFGKLPES